MAASDCLRHLWPVLSEDRQIKLERRLRILASEDPRSEVRSVSIRCLPNTKESGVVILERTGDYDGNVRTSALLRAVDLPLDMFSVDSVHLLAENAYTAALNYEASMASTASSSSSSAAASAAEDEPMPLIEEEGGGVVTGTRGFTFSAASRRRREELALFNVLDMLLRNADGSVWAFLNWFPLDSNPQAVLFVLHTLFAATKAAGGQTIQFPADFSTREMVEPLDPHKNIAVAIVFCERLSKQPNGRQNIDDLVPQPLDVCGEFESCPVDSSKTFLLLRLCKFLDYSDESGRSGMEQTLLDILKRKPNMNIVKLVLYNLRLVQNVVQKYTEQVVQVILSEWLDYTDSSSWDGVLSVTHELLASLPLNSVEFASLSRIEEDILGPAKRPVSESQDPPLHAKYTKCIGSLGKFVTRTRDEHFDDLCFWVTNQKKSPTLRSAAITALVDWFLLKDVQLNGSLDVESFSGALLKIINDTALNAPLTFAALAAFIRLLFSNTISSDNIISHFFQTAFIKIPMDQRLKALLSSFLPTWASYPESRPIICNGLLHLIRHFPDDVPTPQRKLIYRYILRLIFEHSTESKEMGNYNFSIAKKCLKTLYASERADPMDLLKELDFAGLDEQEKQQIDRMLGKVATKFPVYASATNRILGALLNPAEPKTRSNAKFPEPPQKKDKPSSAQLLSSSSSRLSLDSEAHKRLSSKTSSAGLDHRGERTKKRTYGEISVELDSKDPDSSPTTTTTHFHREDLLSKMAKKFEQLDEYKLVTAANVPKTPSKSESRTGSASKSKEKASETSRTTTKRTSEPDSPFLKPTTTKKFPASEPRPKRPKLAEPSTDDNDEELTDTNVLLRQLEMRLGADAKALEKIKDLTKLLTTKAASPAKTITDSSSSRRLVAKNRIGGKMMDDEEDYAERIAKNLSTIQKNVDLEDDEMIEEPVSSRPKRTRTSVSSSSKNEATFVVPSSPPKSRTLRSKATSSTSSSSSSLVFSHSPIVLSDNDNEDKHVEDVEFTPPPEKRSKRRETNTPSQMTQHQTYDTIASRSKESRKSSRPLDDSQPTPSQSPTKRNASKSTPSSSTETITPKKRTSTAIEDPETDWKKHHFPALAAPRGTPFIGFVGFASHLDESRQYREKLEMIGMETEEVTSFSSSSHITHLVVRKGERSRTSCCYGVRGIWLMSTQWVEEIIKRGKLVPEGTFGARINKSLFQGQNIFFSPLLQSNGTTKRYAQAMIKEGGGSVTINGSKAHYILSTAEDDTPYLHEQFEGIPIISVTSIINDMHKYV
jgi:hypothetical protein